MRRAFAALLTMWGLMIGANAADLTVSAPPSLTEVFQDIAPVWEQHGGAKLRFNFLPSPQLAKQIMAGAPVDIIVFGDEEWMDWVAQRGLIDNTTRQTIAGNELVLIMPKGQAHPVTISKSLDLGALLGRDGRVAIANPTNLPAGLYTKQALTNLGLWNAVSGRLATTDTLRGVIALVAKGEAPIGIVMRTEAALSANVAIVGTFPAGSHLQIDYPAAISKGGDAANARAFLAFLADPQAQSIMLQHGFKLPNTP